LNEPGPPCTAAAAAAEVNSDSGPGWRVSEPVRITRSLRRSASPDKRSLDRAAARVTQLEDAAVITWLSLHMRARSVCATSYIHWVTWRHRSMDAIAIL